jgi:hypothetical protein
MFYYLVETLFYLVLVYFLVATTFAQWLKYKRAEFVKNLQWIMLEVRLPREINKSPAAMEAILEAFHQGGGLLTWWDKYRKGNMLSWFSLEIASFGGDIRFYVRTQKKFKNIIESYMYAQYPGIEVLEVEDYTNRIRFDGGDYNMFGTNFVLSKDDHLPIRTYMDYGLDKDPKEEYKIDPITPMLEFMGSLKGNEELWYQVLIRTDKFKSEWKTDAKTAVQGIMKGDGEVVEGGLNLGEFKLTQVQKDMIKAIEKSTLKKGFEVLMRGIYLAPKDDYDGSRIPGFMGMLKPFEAAHLNGFMPVDDTSFVFPWQDKKDGSKLLKKKTYLFKKYVLRTFGEYYDVMDGFSFAYEVNHRIDYLLRHGLNFKKWKYSKGSFVLNMEELATLYHFPGKVAGTPTFKRISSTKSEAPSNLPI